MQNGPRVIAWDIVCPSAHTCQDVRQRLAREGDLNTVVVVQATGGGNSWEEGHRLGDYFQAIRVEPRPVGEPYALRLVFQRLPNAGRYWRDLMVRLLRSVSHVDDGIVLRMAYRLEDDARTDLCTESSSVG